MVQQIFSSLALTTALATTLAWAGLAHAQEGTTTPEAAAPAASNAPDPKLVVAKLNGQDITRGDILNMAEGMQPEIKANIDRVFPQLIDYYVFLKLVAAKGRADGLAEDAEVKDMLKQEEDNIIREVFFRRAISAQVTDAVVDARYNEMKAKYDAEIAKAPPQREVRASHILVKTEEEAKAIIEQLKGGGDFAAIAKEKSIDTASGKNGGDLSWFTAEIMVKEFADAAFALKKGEITQTPVKSQFGFHVIRLDDERTKAAPPFETSKDEIRVRLMEEYREKLSTELKDAAQIEVIEPNGGVKVAD